jgi:hypothetical protein
VQGTDVIAVRSTKREATAAHTRAAAALAARRPTRHLSVMDQPVSLSTARDDTLWAVVASVGRTTRIAEIFSNRLAALADLAWREQQVRAYAAFLRTSRQPPPMYTVKPIRRADLPRAWRPLPALGFLHGQFI